MNFFWFFFNFLFFHRSLWLVPRAFDAQDLACKKFDVKHSLLAKIAWIFNDWFWPFWPEILFVFCSFLLELSRGVLFRCDFCIFFMAIQWQWWACNLFWVILSLHWWTWRKTGDFHCLWLPHLIFSVNSWVFRQHPANTLMLGFFPTYLMVRRRKIALDRAESVIWACF